MPLSSHLQQPDDPTTRSGRSSALVPGLCIALVLALATTLSAGTDQVDITIREGTSMAAALSPDGTTVALDLLGSIWTMPVSGGEARRLTDELSDARQP